MGGLTMALATLGGGVYGNCSNFLGGFGLGCGLFIG